MIILSIETSCDETAISIIEANGTVESPEFSVLGNALYSQIDIHKEFGGVYPNMAKREHGLNLVPILKKALDQANIPLTDQIIDKEYLNSCKEILSKEDGLFDRLSQFLDEYPKIPKIDLIVVTKGPGLIPALWVGVSFAKALSKVWGIKVLGANHMKGHITSVLFLQNKTEEFPISNSQFSNEKLKVKSINTINFPALALLISGGHTELVLISKWGDYQIIGQTLDDAVGEAYDKTARILGLPYPGGPKVSKLAYNSRERNKVNPKISLPRPMLKSKDLNFSFSGLKTAVLYLTRELGDMDEETKEDLCREFEDAVTEVLITKTRKAMEDFDIRTLIIGGGVISNDFIRDNFKKLIDQNFSNIDLKIADKNLATDNALMIAMTGYLEYLTNPEKVEEDIIANGNLTY
jgi:N6-L-threonylcarbamoyladenine synthase